MAEKFQHVSLDYLEEISGGDNNFKKELIQIFLKQVPEFISNMHQYLDEKKYDLLAKEAHTAKSSVLIFMMEETGATLKKIQLLAEEDDIDPIPEMLNQVENALDGAVEELGLFVEEL
mgnify:CR=1 FL=1